ncbi:hypothetical protein [Corallococcus macrosporus]|uniref:Uncharacterized protein n=1 Tax=Corallococcus macrosporus DSM 14697 TaxID=1189310 RepID=A0A250JS90_9BACT|nr:hypothetical protein [Corallococcus macrosporus]ATB46337.1 hypothetical protein MYMAC_001929 [Corallococcus macrosporus DSM 14697]
MIKKNITLTILLTILALPRQSQGGEPPPDSPQIKTKIVPLFPYLRASGKLTGDAAFSIGADINKGLPWFARTNLTITPFLNTNTKSGIARLISTSTNDKKDGPSTNWRVGLGITILRLGVLHPRQGEDKEKDQNARFNAFNICKGICTAGKDDENCKIFREKSTSHSPESIQIQDLCSNGRSFMKEHSDKLKPELTGIYPASTFSAAFAYGQDRLEYLNPTTTQNILKSESTPKNGFNAAASYFINLTEHAKSSKRKTNITFEIMATWNSAWTTQKDSAEYCVPAGAVQRPDSPVTDPAEICKTLSLGPIERNNKLRIAPYVGIIDKFNDDWRIALGPTLGKSSKATEWGIEMPLYVSLLSLPGTYSGEYKGIFRIIPRAQWTREDGADKQTEFLFSVSIELLSQLSLIPRAADFIQ